MQPLEWKQGSASCCMPPNMPALRPPPTPCVLPARRLQWTACTCLKRNAAAGAASSLRQCMCRWWRGTLCQVCCVPRHAMLRHAAPHPHAILLWYQAAGCVPCRVAGCCCSPVVFSCLCGVSRCQPQACSCICAAVPHCSPGLCPGLAPHRPRLTCPCLCLRLSAAFPGAELTDIAGEDAAAPLELISDFHQRMEKRGRSVRVWRCACVGWCSVVLRRAVLACIGWVQCGSGSMWLRAAA